MILCFILVFHSMFHSLFNTTDSSYCQKKKKVLTRTTVLLTTTPTLGEGPCRCNGKTKAKGTGGTCKDSGDGDGVWCYVVENACGQETIPSKFAPGFWWSKAPCGISRF